jgi:hypothetical protein
VIQDHEVGFTLLDGAQRRRAVCGQSDLMPHGPEQVTEHETHILIVVCEEEETHREITT